MRVAFHRFFTACTLVDPRRVHLLCQPRRLQQGVNAVRNHSGGQKQIAFHHRRLPQVSRVAAADDYLAVGRGDFEQASALNSGVPGIDISWAEVIEWNEARNEMECDDLLVLEDSIIAEELAGRVGGDEDSQVLLCETTDEETLVCTNRRKSTSEVAMKITYNSAK